MATIAPGTADGIRDDRAFFLTMAVVMATILVAGFSLNLVMGRSSFALPPIYHLHAVVFMGWIGLYVVQNALVAGGSLRLHRRLGWLALGWIPAMVVLAVAVTLHAVRNHGGPPFFDMNEFLIANPMGILFFAGTALAAIHLRRRTDWHRRLMYVAMASITGPGFGRLLPLPFLIPWSWWIAAWVAPMVLILIGMAADLRRTGRVHRAWWWGAAAFTTMQVAADVIAYSPAGLALTRAVVAGTPGAAREMAAHFP